MKINLGDDEVHREIKHIIFQMCHLTSANEGRTYENQKRIKNY